MQPGPDGLSLLLLATGCSGRTVSFQTVMRAYGSAFRADYFAFCPYSLAFIRLPASCLSLSFAVIRYSGSKPTSRPLGNQKFPLRTLVNDSGVKNMEYTYEGKLCWWSGIRAKLIVITFQKRKMEAGEGFHLGNDDKRMRLSL